MRTPAFEVRIVELDGGINAAEILGELDQATVPELQERLDEVIEGGNGSVLVDLSDCEFIDSSGLALLVSARERITASNGRGFGLCCPETQVSRLLEITGLDQAMGLVATRDEALAALRDGAGTAA